jgi:phage anti-repressor protein
MKITDFLKRHSLISSDFIDDFYSFYDEGQNEYDYVIDLEKLSNWLETQKSHLKRLLEDNFEENEDYIIEKKTTGTGKGIGGNNRKRVMLTYVCSKLLCMLSRTEKADTIRRFYVELEKLLISYKDNIVNDLYNQLGIKAENKKIIEKNKDKGLIYILKLDDTDIISDNDTFEAKLGKTKGIENRISQYKVGRIDNLPIVYIYITDNITELENCIKDCLKQTQIVKGTETYKLTLFQIKETIKYCNKLKSQLIKQNKKLLKEDSSYLVMFERGDTNDLMKKIGIVKKDKLKKSSKKLSKKTSKKTSKKPSKKPSKQTSKQTSKKLSKRQSKQTSKPKIKTTTAKPKAKLGRPKKLTNHIDV